MTYLRGHKLSKEEVISKAKTYSTKSEFSSGFRSGYEHAKRNGYLNEIHSFLKSNVIVWTKEKVLERASECLNLVTFQRRYPGAYAYSLRHEFYEEIKNIINSK
ncbi:MAG: hypothetical protein GY909_15860 [Oligoflexia bacterium]|nr:hypothetical protein [Oligoflexia bacterium]